MPLPLAPIDRGIWTAGYRLAARYDFLDVQSFQLFTREAAPTR